MFFEQEDLSFHILDVLEIRQKNVSMRNSGRNFSALSFRLRADTVLKTRSKTQLLKDGFVSYVPARLDYERTASVDELIVVHFDAIDYTTHEIESFCARDPDVFAEVFGQILACWSKREPGYRYRCSAILNRILLECYTQNFVARQCPSKIGASVAYLMENYKRSDLSIREIADRSFISEPYFRKLFKAEYGVSPQKYIIDLRIQYAVGLISTGDYSLQEIADLSGYNDYKYFSVEFKKAMGVSPSEYWYNYGRIREADTGLASTTKNDRQKGDRA